MDGLMMNHFSFERGYLSYMKYIISESQYRVLLEDLDSSTLWIKRRANYDIMNEYIDKALDAQSNPCDDFDTDVDFAKAIIVYAVMFFLKVNDEFYHPGNYGQYLHILYERCKEMFFDSLLEDYRFICPSEE
jgi:hypothetical protein